MVKNLLAMWESWVRSLSWEDPLEKGVVTHSSILAWAIPWTEKPGGLSPWCREKLDTTERLTTHCLLQLFLSICAAAAAAAAAKSLQSCPTLCDPIDGSPPGSSVPGILQARTLEWVAISFSNA